MEYFELLINSGDAMNGSTTPHITTFNLGNVYDFVPNAYKFQQSNYCFVKVKFFEVKDTAHGAGVILININNALPNSSRTETISSSNPKNLGQSGLIGVVPTSSSSHTYSSNTYENDFVKCNNILNGNITFTLTNETGTNLSLNGSKPWTMLLCVGFEKNPELLN